MKFLDMCSSTLEKIKSKNIDKTSYLFLENDIYTYKLDYEKIILSFYVGIKNVNKEIVSIFNHCDDNSIISSTLSNMKFYKFISSFISKNII